MGAGVENPNGQEVVCSYPTSSITSGGGFSNYNKRPAYQSAIVDAYLQLNIGTNPPMAYFNYTNRGYPDVAYYNF